MSAKLSESGCGLVAAWGGYATLRILVRQGKLGHLIDEEIDNVTIGTGASGFILSTDPSKYLSSITSPMTRIFFPLKAESSCNSFCFI